MGEKRSRQIVFTRSDKNTEYQKNMFDMISSWGYHKTEMLATVFKMIFTEEEMRDRDRCMVKIYEAIHSPATVQIPLTGSKAPEPHPVSSYKEENTSPEIQPEVQPTILPNLAGNTEHEPDPENDLNDLFNQLNSKNGKDGEDL